MCSDKRHVSPSESGSALRDVLPKTPDTDPCGEKLVELIAKLENKKVPVNSFLRLWLLGSMQAKVVFGYSAYWLRSRFASGDEQLRLKNEAHLEAALQLLASMGYLRGAVSKIGQMLATLPEIVPQQFSDVLESLHFNAPPMHYALVREVFLDEFGCEPEQLFASFERKAFAAASLGQVHRATLPSGEVVAVKIQYPDIARTIRSDLRNLRALLQPLRFSGEWPYLQDKLQDIEQMLLQETDYAQEAAYTRQAGELYEDSDQIVVPRVFEEFSSARVLTLEYLPGKHLHEFLADEPDQAQRDHAMHLLLRSMLRPYYRKHWYIADPHPGNVLFLPDGRLGLLDFGCTRVMNDDEWRLHLDMEQAYLDRDYPRIERRLAEASLFDSPAAMQAEHLQLLRDYSDWQVEPWAEPGPFDLGDEAFYRRGIDLFVEIMKKGYTRGAPLYLWTNRSTLGYRSLGYHLKGRVDVRALLEQERLAAQVELPGSAEKMP